MYDKIKVTGIVIAAMPVGETDRRITILTKERGKISAFARGARKPVSALLACSQTFSYGEFVLFEGRDSYNLESAEIKDYFGDIRKNADAIWYGMYFCEFATYMTRESVEPGGVLNLLYCALRALSKDEMPYSLIRRVFEIRYLTEDGEMPEVYTCVKCRKEGIIDEPGIYFDAGLGGVLCENCFNASKRSQANNYEKNGIVKISRSTVYTLQYIVSTPLARLFSFRVADEVQAELNTVCKSFLAVRVNHRMNSEEMLEELW